MSSYLIRQSFPPEGKSPASAVPEPYRVLSKCLLFPNIDEHQWWYKIGPMMAKLFSTAQYDVHLQYRYLCFFGLHVIPMLGPFPELERKELYRGALGQLGSLEISQNFTSRGATIRIGLEPTSYRASTGFDELNRTAADKALARLRELGIPLDLRLYHQLSQICLTDMQEEIFCARDNPPAIPFKTHTMLAFDLKGDNITTKLYFYPMLKALAEGRKSFEVVSDAVQKIDTSGLFRASFSTVKSFFDTFPDTTQVISLACDLVDPAETRLKIYFREYQVDFESVTRAWTLGKRLSDDETMRGLDILRELWVELGIVEGLREASSSIVKEGCRAPIGFNFEIHPNNPLPKPKIYLPILDINDMKTAKVITEFLRRHGCAELAETYVENLSSYVPGFDLEETSYVQGILSFSYDQKNGVYLTVYYR